MEWQEECVDYGGQSARERFPDQHLQSAIRPWARSLFKQGKLSGCPGYLKGTILKSPIDHKIVDPDSEVTYGILLQCISSIRDKGIPLAKEIYGETYRCILRVIQDWSSQTGVHIPHFPPVLDNYILGLYSNKTDWDNFRNALLHKHALSSQDWSVYHHDILGIEKIWYCGYFAIFQMLGKFFLYDVEQVLMLSDTIASRVNTIIYHSLLPKQVLGKVPIDKLLDIYQRLDSLFLEQGNMSYNIIAKWESMIISTTLKLHDSLHYPGDYTEWFLDSIQSPLEEKLKILYLDILNWGPSPSQCSELHGIYRHWGHPTVDERAGCHKVKTIGGNRPVPQSSTILELKGVLNRMFIVAFINKHGRWPALKLSNLAKGRPIHKLVKTQSKVIDLYSPKYPLEDWALIEFEKNFDFDYYLDFTQLLEDTSIAPYRSEFRAIYNRDILGYRPPPLKSSRRVLLEALSRPEFDIRRICDLIRLRQVPFDWLIICLHAKERELKILARLFAMMVLEMRIYFCVTEKNISETLFKYFPQQTMTLDDNEIQKRLLNLSTDYKEGMQFLGPIIGMDFKSWNLCFTRMSTNPFFRFCDDVFGTPGLYTYTHEFFESCLIVLSSHLNPPGEIIKRNVQERKDPEEEGDQELKTHIEEQRMFRLPVGETVKSLSQKEPEITEHIEHTLEDGVETGDPPSGDLSWYNHLAGFEGLRQKGWTGINAVAGEATTIKTGIKSYQTMQGDNYVVKVILPVPDQYKSPREYLENERDQILDKIRLFLNTFTSIMESLGLYIKKEETWIALDLLSYGKDIYHKGVAMPQGSKRISRLLSGINEVFPTTATNLSSLQTAADSCSIKTYEPITPHIMGLLECYNVVYMQTRILFNLKKVPRECLTLLKEDSFITFLMLCNSEIWGIPILNILDSSYRGHPDPVTGYITFVHQLCPTNSLARRVYYRLTNKLFLKGTGSEELLVVNPCSINIKKPRSIASYFRNEVESFVQSVVANENLKEIFSDDSSQRDKEFCEYILCADPLHPRILHEIFSSSEPGFKLSFLSKFSNTRTIQSNTKRRIPMRQVLDTTEKDFLTHLFREYKSTKSVKDPGSNSKRMCPTLVTQSLRDWSWKEVVNNRKLEGVTVPHPSHQFKISTTPDGISHDYCLDSPEYFLYSLPGITSEEVQTIRGPYPIYLGSKTKEKIGGKILKIPRNSAALKSAERCLQIRNWVSVEGSEWYTFLTNLALSRTSLPETVLDDATGKILGGSIVHRLDDHVTKRSTHPNVRPNISSHCYYSCDLLGRFSRGQDNYLMHFQGCIQYALWVILGIVLNHSGRLSTCFHAHYDGSCCEEKLEDFFIDVLNPPLMPDLSPRIKNPLIFADFKSLPSMNSTVSHPLLRLVRSPDAGLALGSILMRKWMTRSSFFIFGPSDTAAPGTIPIGVGELLSIGIERMLDGFSLYAFLYLPSPDSESKFSPNPEQAKLREMIIGMPENVFEELSQLCLFPEFTQEILELSNHRIQPCFFGNTKYVMLLLKNLVIRKVRALTGSPHLQMLFLQNLVFFKGCQLGISRIFSMWAKAATIVTQGMIDPSLIVAQTIISYPTKCGDWPSVEFLNFLYNNLTEGLGVETVHTLLRVCPLQISDLPPELVCRQHRTRKKLNPKYLAIEVDKKGRGSYFLSNPQPSILESHQYPLSVEFPLLGGSKFTRTLQIVPEPDPIDREKLRNDQQFRVYGTISTSFLKIVEILIREKIQVSGKSCVTLAEGEGSIAKLLLEMGCIYLYYNSLVDQETLVPQRAPHFIPSGLAEYRQKVKLADMCAMTGGDLTEPRVLRSIIQNIQHESIALVTCDAESSMIQIPSIANKILLAWLAVACASMAPNAIIKTYCNHVEALLLYVSSASLIYHQIKIVVPHFSSHENYEVYLVASKTRNVSTTLLDEILQCHKEGKVIGDPSALGLLETAKGLKTRRIHDFPFLSDKKETILPKFFQISKSLNFPDNAINNLDFLTGFVIQGLSEEINFPKYLQEVRSSTYKAIQRNMLTKGQEVPDLPDISTVSIEIPLLERFRAIHKTLDRYAVILLNCSLLEKAVYLKDDNIISQLIHNQDYFSVPEMLEFYQYNFSLDPQVWRKKYLKNFWRIIGHYRYRKSHECSISW